MCTMAGSGSSDLTGRYVRTRIGFAPNALSTWISPVAMSGRSGVGTEPSNASASARRRIKVSAVSGTCGHSASASRNSGSTSSMALMVGGWVRLGRDKTVRQRLPDDKSTWLSHMDEQAGHRVPPKGRGPIQGGLASSIFGAEYALTRPEARRRAPRDNYALGSVEIYRELMTAAAR